MTTLLRAIALPIHRNRDPIRGTDHGAKWSKVPGQFCKTVDGSQPYSGPAS